MVTGRPLSVCVAPWLPRRQEVVVRARSPGAPCIERDRGHRRLGVRMRQPGDWLGSLHATFLCWRYPEGETMVTIATSRQRVSEQRLPGHRERARGPGYRAGRQLAEVADSSLGRKALARVACVVRHPSPPVLHRLSDSGHHSMRVLVLPRANHDPSKVR
jgi:hypothetical protein